MNNKSIVAGPEKKEFLKVETLIEIFKNSVQLFPEKTALIYKDESITYKRLDKWTDSFAAHLQDKGLQKGNACIVWLPRGLELHVAIISILKCGAAYVPMDFEMPQERVVSVINDIKASHCITPEIFNAPCTFIRDVRFDESNLANYCAPNLKPQDICYVLFTSGTTGAPKGIPILHCNICQLIRAENEILGICNTDKVYQGFSVSFDMWCEETWISLFVGATIWISDEITSKAIDELSLVLLREEITVLHAVPSLLSIMDNITLPKLRIVNAGGEACTLQAINKWANGKRKFFNSYGPTETTVTAAIALLEKNDPITIGKPLANYGLAIVNETMDPVEINEQGELIISGAGVSKGYLNMEELTKEKFLRKPFALSEIPGNIIYRTGDAAYMDENYDIYFVGRLDNQVKLRGYRIELAEIESELNIQEGVMQAALALKKDNNGQDQLTGYVQLKKNATFNEATLKEKLGLKLPPYMIPYVIVVLEEMPRLPSGKLDRKRLPVPTSYSIANTPLEIKINENDSAEMKIKKILESVFVKKNIELKDDFFSDLGGHSLLAASFVSRVRKEANISNASLKDIYIHRPLESLVKMWSRGEKHIFKQIVPFNKIPKWRYITCAFAQTVSLLIIYGLFAAQIFIPYLGYYYMLLNAESHGYALITAFLLFCTLPPLFSTIGIIAKWLIIGKYKEGEYPLWGSYYFRWWLVKAIQKLVPIQFMNGTSLFPFYLKLMGVKIAPDAQISAITIGAEDLIIIGSDVSISSYANINNAVVENGMLKLSKIFIHDHAYIGSSAVVGGNTIIEPWGELQDLSYLQEGKRITQGQIWKGSPAEFVYKRSGAELIQPVSVSSARRKKYSILFSVSLLFFPLFILMPLVPTIFALSELDLAASDYNFSYVTLTPFLSIIYLVLFALESILLSRLLQRGIKGGVFPLYSKIYFKKWLVDQMNSLSLIVLHPIYATVFVSSYFRALGARVGKDTEISTASSVTHPLLEIGNSSFIADAVTLGEADVRGQQLILDKTSIGNNSFVGNSALIPQGYHLPGNMLIGVLSTPPDPAQLNKKSSHDWFGSPPLALPRRQDNIQFDPSRTFNPSLKLKTVRTIVEFIRIIIPQTVILICSVFFIAYGSDLLDEQPLWRIFLLSPLYYLAIMGLPAFFITVLLKWIIVGRYNAFKAPMWSWKVWRSEAITSTYEALAIPFLLEFMMGTPWLPFLLKFLGVKTGKRVFMNTADITEFDMVTLGNDVAMNEDCGPQTHLFEDRIMKVGTIKIGDRTSIGSRTIILYDSEIGTDIKLEPLSLVMKGETLPDNTRWAGSPVSKV